MKNPASNKTKIEIIADECVDKAHVDFLRRSGYKLKTVGDLNMRGSANGALLKWAVGKRKVFLTEDQDFGNILLYPPHLHHGVIVLKSNSFILDKIQAVLKKLLSELGSSDFEKTLVIVDKNRYRLRRE